MQPQNIDEYKLLRTEILDIRNCITDYMGFLLGGSCLALGLLGFLYNGRSMDRVELGLNSVQAIGYLSGVFSVLVTLVAVILAYKFKSHNRYVAYCRLLSQEQWMNVPDSIRNGSAVGWEWCLTILYEEQYEKSIKRNLDERTNHIIEHQFAESGYIRDIYDGYKKYEDREVWNSFVFLRGLLHVFYSPVKMVNIVLNKLISSRKKKPKLINTSWIFPRPIVLSVFVITMVFVLVGIVNTVLAKDMMLWFAFIFVIEYQLYMWWNLFRQIYHILDRDGYDTIDAYQWRFMPIRDAYLEMLGVEVDWWTRHPVRLRAEDFGLRIPDTDERREAGSHAQIPPREGPSLLADQAAALERLAEVALQSMDKANAALDRAFEEVEATKTQLAARRSKAGAEA
jgi:hypothetical protein